MDSDADALAWCMHLARTHYENFPVASLLLPSRMRTPIAVAYAFARTGDDIADESWMLNNVIADKGARLRGLAFMDAIADSPADYPRHPIARALIALAPETGVEFFSAPLKRLITAFRSDIDFTAPNGWHDVHAYCQNSANPVGELVLLTSGAAITPDMLRQSNAICTALQIINFLQDLSIDLQRGRRYLPCERIDASCVAKACTIADSLLKQGKPLTRERVLPWRLRHELGLIVAGGTCMLDHCKRMGTDLLRHRPTLGWSDYVSMFA